MSDRVDDLARFFAHPEQPGECVPEHDDYELADALLASDWLAARDADLRERIAVAIEANCRAAIAPAPHGELCADCAGSARIARISGVDHAAS